MIGPVVGFRSNSFLKIPCYPVGTRYGLMSNIPQVQEGIFLSLDLPYMLDMINMLSGRNMRKPFIANEKYDGVDKMVIDFNNFIAVAT